MTWSRFFIVLLVFLPMYLVVGDLFAQDYNLPSDKSTNLESVKKGGEIYSYKDEASPKKSKESKSKTSKNTKPKRNKIFNNLKFAKSTILVFKVLAFVLLIFILAYILYQIIGSASNKNKKEYDAVSLEFAKKNLTTKLEEELGEGQYRMACRTLYLQLLQKLVDWRAVIWRNEKTNWDYFYEAKSVLKNKEDSFKSITKSYDLLWYGLKEPSLDEFNKFKNSINQILNEE